MEAPADDIDADAAMVIEDSGLLTEAPRQPDDELTTAPIPMAQRLSLVSWGTDSLPSVPSLDDSSTVISMDEPHEGMGSIKSSTMSVASSNFDFVEENGRTYHRYKAGKYLLPNDVQEQERLDLQHALFLLTTQGQLYLAPISESPRNVLDFATGTGIWAIEFAQMFPGARVLGTDLSPIQPDYIPSNCSFEIDDAEDDWVFSSKFDYIHGRAVASCFKEPSSVIQQAFKACAPGGYLELQDAAYPFRFAGNPDPGSALYRWAHFLCEGAARAGRPLTNAQHYKRWMEESGFEDVVERRFYWPNGPWAKGEYYKTVGRVFQENLLSGLEGISLKVLGLLGWPMEQISPFLAEVRAEVEEASVHAFLPMLFVYGRKPASSASPN